MVSVSFYLWLLQTSLESSYPDAFLFLPQQEENLEIHSDWTAQFPGSPLNQSLWPEGRAVLIGPSGSHSLATPP